jgi:hypothetical protein
MKTLTIPQKTSIYRESRLQSYSYDDNTQSMTIDALYVVEDASLMDWGRLCLLHRQGNYGDMRQIAMSLYYSNPTICLF